MLYLVVLSLLTVNRSGLRASTKCPTFVTMQNELSLLGSLSHPRVVRLFTHYHTPTHSYLLMELVAGGDLFEAIAERGKFPEEEAGMMVSDVSEALSYIHGKSIVHRDLKPENLLVSEQKWNCCVHTGRYKTLKKIRM